MDEAAEKAIILAAIADPSAVQEMLQKGISQKTFGHSTYRLAWRILATLRLSEREINVLSLQSEAGSHWGKIEPLVRDANHLSLVSWEEFLPSLKAEEAHRGIDAAWNQYEIWKKQDRKAVRHFLPSLIHILSCVGYDSQVIDPRPSAIYRQRTYGEAIPTGLRALDQQLDGGYRSGQLIVFGAPSGHGKTALAGSLVANAAANEIPTVVFSLELDQFSMLCRVLCAYANVTWDEAANKKGADEDADARLKAALKCVDQYVRFYPPSIKSPEEIDARISWHTAEFGAIGLVIVDHIGRVRDEDLKRSRLNQPAYIGEMAYGLAESAVNRNTTLVVFSQLSEEQVREFKAKRDVQNLVFKGSGDIFNAAYFSFIFMRHPDIVNVGFFRKKKDRHKGDTKNTRFDIPHWPQYYLFANDRNSTSEQS